MAEDGNLGFLFLKLPNGDVLISHHGRRATVLRKDKADWFVEDMGSMDSQAQQKEMARITGNYLRGNE